MKGKTERLVEEIEKIKNRLLKLEKWLYYSTKSQRASKKKWEEEILPEYRKRKEKLAYQLKRIDEDLERELEIIHCERKAIQWMIRGVNEGYYGSVVKEVITNSILEAKAKINIQKILLKEAPLQLEKRKKDFVKGEQK